MSCRKCAVFGCNNVEKKRRQKLFYRFPGRDFENDRKKKWIEFVRNGLPDDQKDWLPSQNSRICSAHFVGFSKSNIQHHPSYLPTVCSPAEDKISAVENSESIKNMLYSSSLCEERRTENFLNRAKKETEFNFIYEEILIKDERLFEATDSDSEEKSNNKLLSEAMNKLDKISAVENSENIKNMQYSSSLCEGRRTENFLNKVKKETEFNLIPEEILIKDERLFEATYSDSEEKSNNKLLSEGMNKLDEFSALENPENINGNICEERHIENFLNRVKKETEFNLIPEEIQIKDERLFEATDSDSEDISNNKLLNQGTNKPGGKIDDQIVDSAKRYKCDQCHKTFDRPNNLQRHSRIHTGERPFKCTTCEKTFSRIESLSIHNRTHTGEKPYECDICHKKFKQITDLTKHKRIHNNERPFKCSVCHNSFIQSCHLSQHMRIHTGEKPFHCQVCQYKFANASSLKRHMRLHVGDRPFTDNNFTSSEGGKIDDQTVDSARRYKCDQCHKAFNRPSHLQRHSNIHTGKRPFKCTTCKKTFTQLHHLNSHEFGHTIEKPYECDVCNKTFVYKKQLIAHKQINKC